MAQRTRAQLSTDIGGLADGGANTAADVRTILANIADSAPNLPDDGTPLVSVGWTDVSGKPATFPPAAHTHDIANVTGLQSALDGKASSAQGGNADTAFGWGDHASAGYLTSVAWGDVTEKPDVVQSNTAGIAGADQITNIVSLTQAEYDAIGSPSSTTFYVITA